MVLEDLPGTSVSEEQSMALHLIPAGQTGPAQLSVDACIPGYDAHNMQEG
jgi:hypothetical protein